LEQRWAFYPHASLNDVLARLGDNEVSIPVVEKSGKSLGFVSPLALARAYARGREVHATCADITEPAPTFRLRDRLLDHRSKILRNDRHEFLVHDDSGAYRGVAKQQDLLYPPRARLVLVDHNELSQAVPGAEEAEIVGVLDHHRLGNPPTAAAIPFLVEPVGSSSTLVTEQYLRHRLRPPRGIAGMLLSGILSDTLVFRSPTTTPRDQKAAAWLGSLCTVDILLYGKELLRAAPGLAARTPVEILEADRKTYEMAGVAVSIAQIEVTGMQELPDLRATLIAAMAPQRQQENLALLLLMVTDVLTGRSHLLASGDSKLIDALPFPRLMDSEYDLGEIVSRKKQLAPLLQSVLETALA
jgi:manganese-dependent inorganic pyrophosphatase